MFHQNLERNFDKINELYSQYSELVLKQQDSDFQEKWKSAFEAIKDKIVIEVCRIYFKFENLGSKEAPVTQENKNDDNYSDVVVEEILHSLSSYEESAVNKENFPFSIFVCTNVKRAVGKAKSKAIASSNQGGSEISDYEALMIRKIIKTDKQLKKFGLREESSRIKEIANLLNIGIDTAKKYLELGKCKTLVEEQESKSGEKYSVLDLEKNLTQRNFITPESELLSLELKEKLTELLQEMEKIYQKKKDSKLSEILAITILNPFKAEKTNFINNNFPLANFYFEIYNLLKEFKCIDRNILKSFFEIPDYVLPSYQKIADKYGIDKSAVNKILERFRGKLALNKKLSGYFEEFIKNW